MNIVLKRIFAYIIDIILVSLVATLLTSNQYINKDYNKYSKEYKEYELQYENYNEFLNNLNKYYSDSKLSEKEYKNIKKNNTVYIKYLTEAYEDKKLTNKEYDVLLDKVDTDFSLIETNYSYNLLKYSVVPTIVSIMTVLLYFVVIQFYFEGQTLGKKIMNIRVISSNKKSLTMLNFFIRSLIVNEVLINILNLIFLLILSKNNYIIYNQIIYVITYILEM